MHDAEDRIDAVGVFGSLLEGHDREVELLQVLAALGDEHRQVVARIHQLLR